MALGWHGWSGPLTTRFSAPRADSAHSEHSDPARTQVPFAECCRRQDQEPGPGGRRRGVGKAQMAPSAPPMHRAARSGQERECRARSGPRSHTGSAAAAPPRGDTSRWNLREPLALGQGLTGKLGRSEKPPRLGARHEPGSSHVWPHPFILFFTCQWACERPGWLKGCC
jgi:hypothetical protein